MNRFRRPDFRRRKAFTRFIYSFPIQLLVVMLKKNHLLLLYWVVLFGWVTESLSKRFGIPYLFLDPEYMGTVGFLSFFIMGFATGAFIMVFNISSYIINGFRFPFIATLSRPFLKYTINNFILPALFVLVYLGNLISFQLNNEYQGLWSIISEVTGFLIGMTLIFTVTLTYFFRTNKDIVLMFGMETSDADPNAPVAAHVDDEDDLLLTRKLFTKKKKPAQIKEWRVDTYLSSFRKVKLVRHTGHYTRDMVESVFRQNHLNAAIIEIIVFGMFILMGLFKEYSLFKIPAGASVMLTFSLLIMLSSAFRFWLKSWAGSAFILLILVVNFLSQYGIFYPENKAYGLDYTVKKSAYDMDAIRRSDDSLRVQADMAATIAQLEKWKEKAAVGGTKPKMIFVNCSGGGLRASIWAFRIMQLCDSLTDYRFTRSTQLISGASGGMIGAAYYRELFLRQRLGLLSDLQNKKYIDNIGKDLLNPVTFSISVSDLFLNVQKFREGNNRYSKDRAYAFENQLNENTGSVMVKRLQDYRKPESEAMIPMMVFAPTIVNDGRRLLISPQPISYLTTHRNDSNFNFKTTYDEVEFSDLFREQQAGNIRFISVLRMNATFPYILPAVSLPSEPMIQVMDAGIRDNTGMKTSLRFLHTFRKWIEENTSGVIFVDIRDSHKERPIEEQPRKTFIENITTPLGNIYGNLLTIQDYNQDESYEYAKAWLTSPFDFIIFELPTKEQEISLSWHLTTRERRSVYNSVYLEQNQVAIARLLELMKPVREQPNKPLLTDVSTTDPK